MQTCAALETPVRSVIDAVQDTIRYYKQLDSGNSSSSSSFSTINNTNKSLKADNIQEPSAAGAVADALTLGQGRALVSEFLTSNESRLSGRRLFRELGSCNYTTLTFAPGCPSLLRIAFLVAAALLVLLFICSPPAIVTWLVWVVLFPMIVWWVAYGVSPLCWPMLPPHLPRDLSTAVRTLIPLNTIRIPRFMVSPNCTVRGTLSDGTYSPQQCFRRCTEAPFLMISWRDPLTWWTCEWIPKALHGFYSWMLPRFEQDSEYFYQVLAFEDIDPDFVAAHRMCAFMTSYQIVFAIFVATTGLLVLPSVLLAIAEIVSAALVLLSQASAAQAVE